LDTVLADTRKGVFSFLNRLDADFGARRWRKKRKGVETCENSSTEGCRQEALFVLFFLRA